MFTKSLWLSLVIFLGVAVMFLVTKGVGGNSAKYFIKQQQSLGEEEGFIQEMISGQKVVKVFCHEDESIEKFIKMLKYMNELDIRTVCFNWMAHIGWLRTNTSIKERGDALVTGFNIDDFKPIDKKITSDELWNNYSYFINAVVPYAEKYNVRLALHPDDPPLAKLGDVERIMVSYENIKKAINIVDSPNLGVTMCQATYCMMGEDLYKVIPELADKIFFVHFRNAVGNKLKFRESFHDNGIIEMANIMKLYKQCNVDVPIRVDHVPLMAGEKQETAGYTALGRLYAIGYLKGILEAI
jgi:mannonate dehydratase